jgi:Flp pilus assembly pilin Flp
MMNFINTQIVKAQAALTVATDHLTDRLTAREEGQAMVEYGLVLVLVSVVAIVGLTAIGKDLYIPGATATTAGVFNKIIFAFTGAYN